MIKKADCIVALDEKDTRDFKSFCDNIDERLKKYHRTTIIVSIPNGISDKVVDRIIAEYSTHGGWKVEKNSDQRDGCWLTFE
jgi:hypothetical protein